MRKLVAVLLVVLAACSTTQVKDSWKDPAFAGPALKQVMVIGVGGIEANRRSFEDGFAKALSEAGVRASTSYASIPATRGVPHDRVVAAARQSGAEGVLVARVMKRDVALTPSYGSPQFARAGFGAWYGSAHLPVATDAIDTYDVLTIETSLWSLTADKPVWTGTTQVSDPRNVAASTAELAKSLIARMKADGVI